VPAFTLLRTFIAVLLPLQSRLSGVLRLVLNQSAQTAVPAFTLLRTFIAVLLPLQSRLFGVCVWR
jgi:hypothetical protein